MTLSLSSLYKISDEQEKATAYMCILTAPRDNFVWRHLVWNTESRGAVTVSLRIRTVVYLICLRNPIIGSARSKLTSIDPIVFSRGGCHAEHLKER